MGPFYRRLAGLLIFSAAILPPAYAEPQDGFGLAVGPTSHTATVIISGVKQHYDSSGAGLTADAQFVVNDSWSINPSVQIALEKARGDLTNNIGNSEAGLQLRHWTGNVFIAPVLLYSVEDVLNGTVVQRVEYGPGVGLIGGWESPTGLTLSVQADAPESLYFSSSQRRTGLWLQLGYRWH